MKARLRVDLLAAMKGKRADEVRVIRALIAAIDNAEAPPARDRQAGVLNEDFRSGSAEVMRLRLSEADIGVLMLAEAEERERAATEYDGLGKADAAEALRAEAQVARRYGA